MDSDYRLLIFDWDGTLMNSEARILACMQAAARDLDLAPPTDDAARNIIGLGLREAVLALFPSADEDMATRLVDRYRHHYLHQNRTPTPLFEGADRVLRALSERQYLLAVATGKGRQGLDAVLGQTGLRALFHATRCAGEVCSKPHPEMLMEILDELGVHAHEALMIGDTEYDLQMARNAGVSGLAVSYGVHSLARLLSHAPVGHIDDIRDLTGWLDRRA